MESDKQTSQRQLTEVIGADVPPTFVVKPRGGSGPITVKIVGNGNLSARSAKEASLQFRSLLTSTPGAESGVTLDVSEIGRISSPFVGMLVDAQTAAKQIGPGAILLNPAAETAAVINAIRLDRVIPVVVDPLPSNDLTADGTG